MLGSADTSALPRLQNRGIADLVICFIVNPVAGLGRAKAAVPIIERMMDARGAAYVIIYTRSSGDFERVAAEIDLSAVETIVCVGGDGTVQEYVSLVIDRDINFAIIPTGSGNDFLHSVPSDVRNFRTLEEKVEFYIEKILAGDTMRVDAIAVNEERYFLNIAGTGIDIQVLKDAQPLKRMFKGAAYFISLIKNAVTYRAEEMTLTVDGEATTSELLLVAICSGAYYGGNLKIAPSAVIDDGLITLCTVRKLPRLKLMLLFPLVKPGKHTSIREVTISSCEEIKIEYQGVKTMNFDGNLYDLTGPLTFKVIKGAVRLIV